MASKVVGMSLNSQLSAAFAKAATVMDLLGANKFKAVAFQRVARLLEDETLDLKQAVGGGTLLAIPGVGKGTAGIIEQFVTTGKSEDLEQLFASVPPGLLELLDIPGLGPKTIATLWKERGVDSIDNLVKAIETGGLAGIKGLGPKKIETIKQGISLRATAGKRRGLPEAMAIAHGMRERLASDPRIAQVEVAGSLRRGKETIGDIDFITVPKSFADREGIIELFTTSPEVQAVLGKGTTKASIVTFDGLQVDIRLVPAESFGAAMMYFTGSKEHNVKLRGIVQKRGLQLNEWGLYDAAAFEKAPKVIGEPPTLQAIASKSEADVYEALGLQYIDPAIRENRGEVELAAKKKLPRLITFKDIRGDLHSHTTASDGVASIVEMAEAAKAMGYAFLAVTDHSKSSVIANGLSEDRMLAHLDAIREAGSRLAGITLLAGAEVDILVDGRLDYSDALLAKMDWVVASPHVSLAQDTEKATARILRAIESPYVNLIGHPTGRKINARAGLPLDFPRVFAAAAASGTALEINAGWPRLDLSDIHAKGAIEAGCRISINTDAHSTEGLTDMALGLLVARRAWAKASDVINTFTLAELKKFVKAKREIAGVS